MPSKFLKENLIIIAVLSLFLCIIFYDVIFLGKTFKVTTGNPQALNTGPYGQEDNKLTYFPTQSTDSSTLEEPIQEFIKKSLWQGFIPLWNPHQGCGYPLIGMMQVGLFFPLNYILYLLPQLYAWDLMILSRIFFAGIFTYWLMRTLKFGKIPSLGAAIVYAFNGPLIVLHGWYANVDILIPFLLLSMERLMRKANLANYCCATAAITLTLLAGHAEHILLIHVFGFAFFCFRLLTIKPHAEKIKTVLYLFFSYLLSVGISAIVLLPFLHNWVTEFWHTHPANMGLLNEGAGEAFRMFITLIIPSFFQKEPVLLNFTRTAVSWWGYIGIIAFMLAFCSLFSRQKQKLNYFFAAAAFVIFSKTHLSIPLINWIGHLPLLKLCRFDLHTPFLFSFTVAILSGMGIRWIITKKPVFLRSLIINLSFLAAVGIALWIYRTAEHFQLSLKSSIAGICLLVFFQVMLFLKDKRILKIKHLSIIIIAFICIESFLNVPRGRVKRFDSFPRTPYIEFLKSSPEKARSYGIFWTLYPNSASGYQLDDLGIVHALLTRRFVVFVNNFIKEDYFTKNYGTTAFWVIPATFMPGVQVYMNLLNVRYTVSHKTLARTFTFASRPEFIKPIYSKEVLIYEHPKALPRAFIVHKAVFEKKEDIVLEMIKHIRGKFREIAVLHHEVIPEILDKIKRAPRIDNSTAEITKYLPNEVIVEADMENPGFLVLSDTYHPGWKAFVDGQESRIYITNFLIRSVFLEKGKHTVHFKFLPLSFHAGRVITLISLLIFLILLIRVRFSNRKNFGK